MLRAEQGRGRILHGDLADPPLLGPPQVLSVFPRLPACEGKPMLQRTRRLRQSSGSPELSISSGQGRRAGAGLGGMTPEPRCWHPRDCLCRASQG